MKIRYRIEQMDCATEEAMIPSHCFVVLAVSGHSSSWQAVFADLGASLIVVTNGLGLLRDGGAHEEAENASTG